MKKIKSIGLIGWRGMVGSALMNRMQEEGDFNGIEAQFFSTSNVGGKADLRLENQDLNLYDAYDVKQLSKLDAIITCQGGEYTKKMHPALRQAGWNGYWIDAASTLRMEKASTIILDPVNGNGIHKAVQSGGKDFIGGNCTVSLMLLALNGLFQENLIEWMTCMTYQAASGAGAKAMRELLLQMAYLTGENETILKEFDEGKKSILDVDAQILQAMKNAPHQAMGYTLAGNVLPWIDSEMSSEWHGMSREEWKGVAETNKILATDETNPIPIDSICVRIATMRCHSQAFTIKMKKDIPLDEVEEMIANNHEWLRFVANNKADSLKYLTPEAVSGTLTIAIGRLRKLKIGQNYLGAFSVGDQLLWGACEPLRRMLLLLKK